MNCQSGPYPSYQTFRYRYWNVLDMIHPETGYCNSLRMISRQHSGNERIKLKCSQMECAMIRHQRALFRKPQLMPAFDCHRVWSLSGCWDSRDPGRLKHSHVRSCQQESPNSWKPWRHVADPMLNRQNWSVTYWNITDQSKTPNKLSVFEVNLRVNSQVSSAAYSAEMPPEVVSGKQPGDSARWTRPSMRPPWTGRNAWMGWSGAQR